ncbi:MAG TPA: efflux RND transporter periplasmic adaptor subunit [Chthoniobacterales bacterium]
MKSFIAVAVAVAIGLGMFYVRREAPGSNVAPGLFATVTRETIFEKVEMAGEVKPEVLIDVKPEISARILRIHVKEGDVVQAGAPIVDLDNTELLTEKSAAETEISIAELGLEQAERVFKRQQRLLNRAITSTSDFEDAETARDVAKQTLMKARQQLDTIESRIVKSKIVAPLTGTVLALPVVPNQVVVEAASVNSGTLLMSMADLSKLIIECHVNQVDVARLQVGMPFEFRVDSLGQLVMKGTVQSIAPMATIVNNIKGYTIELKIDKPDSRLRPGMTAQVTIPISETAGVVAVPVSAIFDGVGDQHVAYVSRKGTKMEERKIDVGVSDAQFAEIRSGLEIGETVSLTKPGSPGS